MTQKPTSHNSWYGKCLSVGILGLLMLVPFHAPITVWFASLGLHYEAVRLWKEVFLLLLVILAAVSVLKHKKIAKELLNDWVVRLILCFVGLVIVNAILVLVLNRVSPKAVGYGLIVDTRMWVFLLVVAVTIRLVRRVDIPRLVVSTAIIAIAFGLLQMTLLPSDFLRHLGYGPSTIISHQAVDSNMDFPRVQSTMRGPNPLGAYLIPVCMLLLTGCVRDQKYRAGFIVALVASFVVLFGTYSRSAWIGAALSVILFAGWKLSPHQRLRAGFVLAGVILLGCLTVYMFRDNNFVQNTVFHSSEASPSNTSSNEQRTNALVSGLKDIARNPLGGGVGSAGPASVHNDSVRISENFFIQVGQELGIAGLLLFVALIYITAQRLFRYRKHVTVLAIMSAYLGLILINMVSHAWSDDTLAYIFGSLLAYGMFAYSDIQNTNK